LTLPHPILQDFSAPLRQESQFLENIFQAIAIDPQPTPVRNVLETGSFDLLHFAGHGLAEQGNIANAKLMLQGRVENGKYVQSYLSATTVEQYSNLSSSNRPMVVLNACEAGRKGYTLTGVGGFAQAFLKGGAGVFVGTLWSVGDRPARMFTETFYEGLMAGLTLAEATIRAREASQQSGDATWLAYVVYGHPYLKVKCQPHWL
jgi:CHAT domain-containing protein